MRKVLFKGKTINGGKWVQGFVINYGYNLNSTELNPYKIAIFECENYIEKDVYEDTVVEWTGLYDKNNVRIFEGDIVKFDNCIYFVEYGDCFDGFLSKSFYLKDDNMKLLFYKNMPLEVIGNKFDNPEFLKEDN